MDSVSNGPAKWEVGALDALTGIIGLAITVSLLVLVYRTMQRPRLHISTTKKHGQPEPTWQAIVRYLVTTPFMVAFWLISLLVILSAAAKSHAPESIALVAAAVVGGARLLAHFDEEMSRELGKTIPLVVLGVILIGRESATSEQFLAAMDDFIANIDQIDTFYWLLVVFDVVVTAAWYLIGFGRWRFRESSAAVAWLAKVTAPIRRPWRALITFGRGDT